MTTATLRAGLVTLLALTATTAFLAQTRAAAATDHGYPAYYWRRSRRTVRMTRRPIAKAGASFARAGDEWVLAAAGARGRQARVVGPDFYLSQTS